MATDPVCLGLAFEAIPEALAIASDGRVHYSNRAFARLFGYSSADELQGTLLARLIPAAHSCARTPATGGDTSEELNRCGYPGCVYEGNRKDGSHRRMESSCSEFVSQGKKWTVLSTRDVTDRERRRVARETEARFRAIFYASPVGICQCTLDGRIVESNPALQTMLGRSQEELRGTDFRSFIHADDTDIGNRLYEQILAGNADNREMETRFVGINGACGVQHVRVSLLRGPDLRPEFLLVMAEDITKRRAAEQQLRDSERMEAIGRLVAGVSHDFNNLLMAVSLYSGLIASSVEPKSRAAHYVAEVKLATEQGAALIKQLLTISRQQPINPKIVRMKDAIEEMREMLGRLVGENIKFTTHHKTEGLVRIDKGQLQQIILNLVLNARDAMPQGGNIVVETCDLPTNSKNSNLTTATVLRITDDGVGIDETTRARLFEPFFTTKPYGRGNGLGLATVSRIVQEAGGSIAVQSSPGEGSCFEISFPISGSPAQSEFSAVAEELAPGGDETLLLVEDNNLIRSSLSKFLRNAGYQVLDAADAEEALRMSRDHLGFDLLVTDLALPGMSGLELATQLREQSPDVAVICISGDIPDPNQYPPEFWERQDIVFVPKSVDPTVLLRKIRQVFDTNLSGSYIGRER